MGTNWASKRGARMPLAALLLAAILFVVIACLAFAGVAQAADPLAGVARTAGPVIVLDPGHSGSSLKTIDPATNIMDKEYLNTPETRNVFEVAALLKTMLEKRGYIVLLTKQHWYDTLRKRDRVNVANDTNAALAVSIHTSGHTFGLDYGGVYVQRTDGYRVSQAGRRVYFKLPDIAAVCAKFGETFVAERRKIEGKAVKVKVNSFYGRSLAPGNLAIVQLWAEVPWVYCEAGALNSALDKQLYAESLYNSIVECVPVEPAAPPYAPLPRIAVPGLVDGGIWAVGKSLTFTATTIKAVKVNFYVDGVLRRTDYVAPFTWTITPAYRGRHVVKVVAYAASANGNTTAIQVKVTCK